MAAVGLMAAVTFAAECGVRTRDGALCRLSDMVVRIDMQNLLKIPVYSLPLCPALRLMPNCGHIESRTKIYVLL